MCARESVQIEFLADQKRKLLFRAISEEVLVLFEVFNPGTYIWFSIKQSNVHFHALSARADDVGGHLTGFLHKDLAKKSTRRNWWGLFPAGSWVLLWIAGDHESADSSQRRGAKSKAWDFLNIGGLAMDVLLENGESGSKKY